MSKTRRFRYAVDRDVRYTKKKSRHSTVEERFTQPKSKRPRREETHMVTDHALVRYLACALGVDIEGLREAMLTAEQKAQATALQTVKIPLGDGIYAVVKGGRVVTVR